MTRNIGLFRIGGQMEIVGDPPDGGTGDTFTLDGQGGTAPYTFTGVSLPSGWSLVAGVLTYGSTPGDYSITVQMADSARNTPVQKTYSITIA